MINNKAIYSLAVFFLLFSGSTFAAECNAGLGGIEKEMLELTYMSKEELAGEYCMASNLEQILTKSGTKFLELGAFDRGMEVMGEGSACGSYAKKVLKVTKKDFQVESFECEEGIPKEKNP